MHALIDSARIRTDVIRISDHAHLRDHGARLNQDRLTRNDHASATDHGAVEHDRRSAGDLNANIASDDSGADHQPRALSNVDLRATSKPGMGVHNDPRES